MSLLPTLSRPRWVRSSWYQIARLASRCRSYQHVRALGGYAVAGIRLPRRPNQTLAGEAERPINKLPPNRLNWNRPSPNLVFLIDSNLAFSIESSLALMIDSNLAVLIDSNLAFLSDSNLAGITFLA